MQMSKKLKQLVSATLLALLFFTVLNVQKAEGADVTVEDLIGKWEARLKINKLELFGVMKDKRDEVYKQEKVPQTVSFIMKEGKLAVSFGSTPVPVTLSGSKLSGAFSQKAIYNSEMTLDGTVNKSAKGIEFRINAREEAWTTDRKNGWISSYTYTSAGATPAPATPAAPAAEVPAEVQEAAVEEVIPVESITIEPKLFFLKVGATRQINVKIKPLDANAEDVIVKSYDSNVIGINSNAVVLGRNAGYSEIVAATRDGKIQTKSRVFVGNEKEVVGLVLDNIWSKTKEFLSGESFQVKTPTATCGVRG